ncbi:MAG: hypothetical protein Q9227_007254 [Pyrenula ochraceoflavens]
MLASAGDDSNILLWVPSEARTPALGDDDVEEKETWRVKHMCRSVTEAEIYDLAWSPDGVFFITGGVDNTARIYNAQNGQLVRQIAEHSHYVQGVAWDPLNEFVATQSSDRSVHIYSLKLKDGTCTLYGKFNKMDLPGRRISSSSPAPPDTVARPSSRGANLAVASPAPSTPGTPATIPMPMDPPALTHSRRSSFGSSPSFRRSASPAPSLPLPAVRPMEVNSPVLGAAMGLGVKTTAHYHNETLTSFFRRLTFAADGSLLFTPSGQFKQSYPSSLDPTKHDDNILNTVYIYTRAGLNKPPIAHLPGHKKPSIAVKCSPIYYTLRTSGVKPTQHITIDTSSSEDPIPALPDPMVSVSSNTTSVMEPPPLTHTPSATSDPSPAVASPMTEGESHTSVFALPYRMIYAVATQDAVLVYDTQQQTPLCVVSNLHYATFSDLTWSNDGLTLLMSSTDGFCSALSFIPGELGQVYSGEVASHRRNRSESHPANILTAASGTASSSASNTPLPTPTTTTTSQSPSLHKAGLAPPSHPSPAPIPPPAHFSQRPTSPTRSNSTSSIATLSSVRPPTPAGSVVQNNPTPTMGHVPLVTAANSGQPGHGSGSSYPGLPVQTPPMTPASGAGTAGGISHSATSSISGNVLGKRDGASESEREDGAREGATKKRRIAPTLVSGGSEGGGESGTDGTG